MIYNALTLSELKFNRRQKRNIEKRQFFLLNYTIRKTAALPGSRFMRAVVQLKSVIKLHREIPRLNLIYITAAEIRGIPQRIE